MKFVPRRNMPFEVRMSEKEVPVVRTLITLWDYARAIELAWPCVDEGPCTTGARAVLYAQYRIETGGRACFNFNVGNVKRVKGDGHNYHCLKGVWEGVTPAQAARLIALGEATADLDAGHAVAVGKGRVSVIFQPPHPATHFRAFGSLEEGITEHLKFLAKRYAPAWPHVISGDYRAFASALKARGYFTASVDSYAAGMRRPYDEAMASLSGDGSDMSSAFGLQAALAKLGHYAGEIDGLAGPMTIASVRAFQRAQGLVVDGVAGPKTRAAIVAALEMPVV